MSLASPPNQLAQTQAAVDHPAPNHTAPNHTVPERATAHHASVAINGNPLPGELISAIDSGSWMDLGSAAARVLGRRFGVRALYPDFYDYVKIVRATEFFVSDEAAGYWPGGLDPALDMDPTRTVLIGDLVGAGEDFLALDYRAETPTVRLLTDAGWSLVADSIPEFFVSLDERNKAT